MNEQDFLDNIAKGLVAYSFRNTVLEDYHAGKDGNIITDSAMKEIMIDAVNKVRAVLELMINEKYDNSEIYNFLMSQSKIYCQEWNNPLYKKDLQEILDIMKLSKF